MKVNQNQQRNKNNTRSSLASSNLNDAKEQIRTNSDMSHGNSDKSVSGNWVLLVFIILIMATFLLAWLSK